MNTTGYLGKSQNATATFMLASTKLAYVRLPRRPSKKLDVNDSVVVVDRDDVLL